MRTIPYLATLTVVSILPAAHACDVCLRSGVNLHGSSQPLPGDTELLRPIGASSSSLSVPQLSSRPHATAKLYLDFDGDVTPQWVQYAPGVTPAYTVDADVTTFSEIELANIYKAWSGVAEKYSPFNIDVTTIDPGPLVKQQSFRVVVGGNGAWYSPTLSAGGVAYIGSFYDSQPTNTAYVFSALLLPNDPLHTSFVTAATSHEAGHGFGLQHQAVWSANGQLLDPYNRGDAFKAPLMGSSYRKRGLWWEGTSLGPQSIQSDLNILSNSSNGFGYGADDHANVPELATPLNVLGDNAFGSGVIEKITDIDLFSFETLAGEISFTLDVAPYDAMLDGSLALYNLGGDLLHMLDTSSLGETLTANVVAGEYRLAVSSHGFYGDIGQYSLLGTILPVPEPAALLIAGAAALGLRRSSVNVLRGPRKMSKRLRNR